MDAVVDRDVKAVVEFIQTHIAASHLVGVAEGVVQLAPIIWGRYQAEPVNVLAFEYPQMRASSENEISQLTAIGCSLVAGHARDDSAAAAGAGERT